MMDYTKAVYLHGLTEPQISRLREIAIWEPRSFPNGSHYRKQVLRNGNYGDLEVDQDGGRVAFADEPGVIRCLSHTRRGSGTGVNRYPTYCTQDQELLVLCEGGQ